MKFIQLAVALQLLFVRVKGGDVQDGGKRVVCYYLGLLSNQSRTLLPEDIDASLCTHLVYFEAVIDHDTEEIIFKAGNEFAGIDYLNRVLKLKEINPDLKVLIFFKTSLGCLQKNESNKSSLINKLVEFIKLHGYDGLEMAFVMSIDDGGNYFGGLLCEMRAEFDKHGLILSTNGENIDQEIEKINRCSDYISVRTMNYWTVTDNVTGLSAPLPSVKSHIDAFIGKGFSAEKLLITIPTFWITFKLKNVNETALGEEVSGPGYDDTEFSRSTMIMYRKLVEKIVNSSEQWTIQRDEATNSPYGSNKDGLWVSYDDSLSAATKAKYVLEKNLGGVGILILDMDDFLGIGGEGTFPLTRAIHDVFFGGKKNESDASLE